MSPLRRKLARDLARMRGQVATIALVIASGIASFVAMQGTYVTLGRARDAYYAASRFADAFATVRRAPDAAADALRAIPGVARVETRVVEELTLEMPGLAEPARALVVAQPSGTAGLNQLHLRAGRLPEPGAPGEVAVSEAFARAHRLRPGDTVRAMVNGRAATLRVVGVALSAEYVYIMPPGAITPNDRRFGVFWMDRAELAAAFQMQGAFNDVLVQLAPGARRAEVVRALDAALRPYGGVGAYGRDRQTSNRFVDGEIQQLRGFAVVAPAIFLAVAAFLVHVALSRLIATQREQIAALKALGYGNGALARHYLELVSVIALLGVAIGVATGVAAGVAITNMYGDFFRFPRLAYRVPPATLVGAVAASLGAAAAGVLSAVRRAVRLPPAEAMRPEAPAVYRRSVFDVLGIARLASPAGRIVLRALERSPVRAALSALGIAAAAAVLVVGRFSSDAIATMMDVQFGRAHFEDVTVTFRLPQPARTADSLRALPGVLRVEPMRVAPVRLRVLNRERVTAITGVDPAARLFRLVDAEGNPQDVPPEGVLVSAVLARVLGVRPGEAVEVESLEADRRARRVYVTGVIDDAGGLAAYMNEAALHRLLAEEGIATGARLAVDPAARPAVLRALRRTPGIAGVGRRDELGEYLREQGAGTVLLFEGFLGAFAAAIAVGVVYNNARVTLAMRARELASLRVLGLTRGEVARIVLGEQLAHLAVGIPVGLALGRALAAAIVDMVDPELMRLPLSISPRTYTTAAAVVLAAAAGCAALIVAKVRELDLVAVLKARD